jgi:hypothetical protein
MGTGLLKAEMGVALVAGLLVLAAAPIAAGQTAGAQSAVAIGPGPLVMLSSAAPNAVELRGLAQGEVVREIDDPNTGDRWLLMRDDQHPGGPGRLLLAAASGYGGIDRGRQNRLGGAPSAQTADSDPTLPRPVIRAGDRLTVEEHTPVVDATLQAVALGPALPGSRFDVRLKIGGKVLRAVALGPGRAVFAPETEARP